MSRMETYTKTAIDGRAWETNNTTHSTLYTPDFTLHKADGTIVHVASETWSHGLPSLYGAFSSHLHSPKLLVCWETSEVWEMLGQADMCVNLRGEGNEPKVRDREGREWDCVTPGAFRFEYVRDEKAARGGILLKSTRIFADSGPVVQKMLRVGQLKVGDLGV